MNPDMKVVYPAPPPTTNELTSYQRAQLVRKARKIEQILGATPQLIDATIRSTSPIHVALPYALNNTQRRLTKVRRSSIDSISSSSSAGSFSSSMSRSSSVSSAFSSRTPLSSKSSFETWPRNDITPKLRLATQSPCLETIPASPPADNSSCSDDHSSSSSFSRPPSRSNSRAGHAYALVATETSPRDSLVLTPLIIPSANSFRKQKMDRLRKKLGADVPFDLVFPKGNETDSSENYPPSLSPELVERRTRATSSPTPVSHQRKTAKKSSGRIASSRDSLVLDVHRAKRQVYVATSPSSPLAYRDKALPAVPNADIKRLKDRLSLIIESPDEHGAGLAEEFGIATVTDITSQWLISSSNKAEIKLWSTRKGYEGWNSQRDVSMQINPDASPISSFTVLSSSSCDDDSSSSSAGPATPDSPLNLVSSAFLNRSPSEMRKRPSSYRKPAPPIPTECY